jgi:hypothetical protein
MPAPEVDYQAINVGEGVLPHPAVKLIITQYLHTSLDPPLWAWIIVAAFFDAEDNAIWSSEIFAAHLDIQFESDDEGDEQEESAYQGSSDQDVPETESGQFVPAYLMRPDAPFEPSYFLSNVSQFLSTRKICSIRLSKIWKHHRHRISKSISLSLRRTSTTSKRCRRLRTRTTTLPV